MITGTLYEIALANATGSQSQQAAPKPDNLETALELAAAGFAVFPCRESGTKAKAPYTAEGFKAATTDRAQIRKWWRRWPRAAVGLPTGTNDLAVLDLDISATKDGAAELADRDLLPRSRIAVRTPSGGKHLIFAAADGLRPTTDLLPDGTRADGVDIRAAGSYIIAPGSVMADGRTYRYLRGNLLTDAPDAWPENLHPIGRAPANSDGEILGLSIRQCRSYLKELAADPAWRDSYQNWVKVGMALHHEFEGDLTGLDLFDDFSDASPHYDRAEILAKWRSFDRSTAADPVTFKTVIDAARGEFALTYAEAVSLFDDIDDDEAAPENEPLFESAADWGSAAPPPREWHVAEMIPANETTLLYGDGATGKSLVALQLAIATSTGTPWLGKTIGKPGKTLLLSAEDNDDELWRRTRAIADSAVLKMSDLQRFHKRSLRKETSIPYLATFNPRSGQVQKTPLFKRLEAEIAKLRPSLIVLDTLANLFGGNENDKQQAMGFIALLNGLASRYGCAVVLLAHPSKSGMSSGDGSAGSVGWSNAVRSRLYLTRIKTEAGVELDPNARELSVMKGNYAEPGYSIDLRWQAGTFIVDRGEEAETRKTRVEKIFLDLLDNFEKLGRHVSPNRSPTFAPKVFANQSGGQGISPEEFEQAMEQLLQKGDIQIGRHGTRHRKRQHIERTMV